MREVLCAAGSTAAQAGLGKPFGAQMVPSHAPSAGHAALGFAVHFAGSLLALVRLFLARSLSCLLS